MKIFRTLATITAVSICSFPIAAQPPSYDEETQSLFIPMAGTVDQPGIYQEVMLYNNGESWQITSGYIGQEVSQIDTVELIQTDSFPKQVFLQLSGTFSSGCPSVGRVTHRRVDSVFEIFVYYTIIPNPSELACTQALVDFSETIALPVYGLEAGTYTYIVNRNVLDTNNSGEFILDVDNSL